MSTDRPANSQDEQRFDRQTLRVAIKPTDEFSPIQAAWLLGRLCNETRHRFQFAWIQFRDNEPERTAQFWSDIRRLAQEVTNHTAQSEVANFIQRTRASWECSFTSEWHSEELYSANCELRLNLAHGTLLPNPVNEITLIVQTVTCPTRLLSDFCADIGRHLSREFNSAFQLGNLADQIIHPPISERSVRVGQSPGEETANSTEVVPVDNERAPLPFSMNCCDNTTQPSIESRLNISERWPDYELLRDIQHSLAHYCRLIRIEYPWFASQWTVNTSKATILDDLQALTSDGELDDGDSGDQPTVTRLTRRGQNQCRSLSLSIDLNRGNVDRTGHPTPIPFPPRLLRLLVHFLNRHGEPFTAQWIGENWRFFSPRTQPIPRDSVYSQINRINDLLSAIDLCLAAESNGYVLRDLRSST